MRVIWTVIFLFLANQVWAVTEQEKMSTCFLEVERAASTIMRLSDGWETAFGERLTPEEASEQIWAPNLLDSIAEVIIGKKEILWVTPIVLENLNTPEKAKMLEDIFYEISISQAAANRIGNLAYSVRNNADEDTWATAKVRYVNSCLDAINAGKHADYKYLANQSEQKTPYDPEIDYLKAFAKSVGNCWSVNVGSRAAKIKLTVGMQLTMEGKIISGSIEMLEFEGGTEADANVAFQSVRRAILRCQQSGYDLPEEIYDQWKYISLVFDPTEMRKR